LTKQTFLNTKKIQKTNANVEKDNDQQNGDKDVSYYDIEAAKILDGGYQSLVKTPVWHTITFCRRLNRHVMDEK
jgi:hypothetical protein